VRMLTTTKLFIYMHAMQSFCAANIVTLIVPYCLKLESVCFGQITSTTCLEQRTILSNLVDTLTISMSSICYN
jgi:hypothetical protein